MPFNKETLSSNLRALRARTRMSQKDVAKSIGVNTNTIINYEDGKSTPSYETAWRLADLYGVTLGELGGRIETFETVRT